MTRTCTTRSVLAALLLTFSLQSAFTQVFWTETFSDQTTANANWASGGTNGGTEVWTWLNDPSVATFGTPNFAAPTATDGFFMFNSDANGEFDHDVTLTGPVIDCSSSTNTKITFWAQYAHFTAGAVAELNVSTDGGATWTSHTLLAGFPVNQMYNDAISVDIPEANGQSNVRLQFRWVGNYEYSWKVDDIELESVAGPVPCDQNPMAIICDNFDSYTLGNVSPQATWWTPWNLQENSSVGSEVSADFASSGTQSMKVKPDGAPAGDDQLLLLGNKSTGRYSLKWKQYVQTGKNAYFNFQQSETPGTYNGEYYFDLDGTGRIVEVIGGSAVVVGTFDYPHDVWYTVETIFDLDNNLTKVFVDGKLIRAYGYAGNIGGVDFYAADANTTYYVDDVEYVGLPPVVYNVDECEGAIDLTTYLGQGPDVPQTTGLYDNTNATVGAGDPTAPACWADGLTSGGATTPKIDGSMWYTFTGDGEKYHIETVPCNATTYNDDTQMAIYTGECGDFDLLLCNEDLYPTGDPDYRAGLDIETESGVTYYMLIDGWSSEGGVVTVGEYCIEITQVPSITCANGAVGTYEIGNNSYLCWGSNLNEILVPDVPSFSIPTVGPVFGMVWCITSQPVPNNAWPGTISGIASTIFSPVVNVVNLPNDGTTGFAAGDYYLTPVVLGGGTIINAANPARIFNVDPTGGCYFVGESVKFTLMPELNPLDATVDVTQPTNPPGNNGSIDLTIAGGFFDIIQDPSAYTVEWTGPNSFTSTDEDITGIVAGDYTAIITDITGCTDPLEVNISLTTSVKDPASVKSLTLSPNPTSNLTTLNLTLANTADVRVEVLNTLGQTLYTTDAGKVNTLSQQIDLSRFTDGTYFLRVTVDGEAAIRRVVLNR